MGENDAAVRAWFMAVLEKSVKDARNSPPPNRGTDAMGFRAGHYAGVIRELSETVPGVREWLLEHMPKGES